MEFHIWLTFAIATFVVSLSPGVGAVVSMNYGLKYGLKKSYPAILGLQVGYLIQAFVVVVGLGAIITKSVMVFN
ncbi:LysE family transporter, partial [Poseidonibacter sp.]|uniref:LysE family transporter n=1 Tax=Poseidonibacter sp. TaxID=2321188 RepID=UPI003C74DDF4